MSEAYLYPPFGSAMPTRGWSDNGREYRFGFKTQEKDNEVAGDGNSYTAEFWQYDGRLGRRWNLDPIPQIELSDYCVLGNDPICNIDVYGDWFADRYTKRTIRKQIRETRRLLRVYKRDLRNINDDIKFDKRVLSGTLLEKQNAANAISLSNILTAISELQDALKEIKTMKTCPVGFQIVKWNKKTGLTTSVNPMFVQIYWDGADNSLLAHELKHGYQYLDGKINFDKKGSPEDLVDITDETAAYKRQIAYSPGRTLLTTDKNNNDITLSYRNLSNDLVRTLLDEYEHLPETDKHTEVMIFLKPPKR